VDKHEFVVYHILPQHLFGLVEDVIGYITLINPCPSLFDSEIIFVFFKDIDEFFEVHCTLWAIRGLILDAMFIRITFPSFDGQRIGSGFELSKVGEARMTAFGRHNDPGSFLL
jgi:hypothetical protein